MILTKFVETFEIIYDVCILLQICKVNKKKVPLSPWITKGLLKNINKNKLYKAYLRNPTNGNLQKIKTYKNKLDMLLRKSKRRYFFMKFKKSKK